MKPTDDIIRLVKTWQSSLDAIERNKRELGSLECAFANAQNQLGKALCPDDARDKETFSIWFGECLLVVTKYNDGHDYKVEWRNGKKPIDLFA